jgi:hypothetical protein
VGLQNVAVWGEPEVHVADLTVRCGRLWLDLVVAVGGKRLCHGQQPCVLQIWDFYFYFLFFKETNNKLKKIYISHGH